MGNVVIAPNIKKESVRISPAGDIINAKTKEVIKPVEPEYVPPVQPPMPDVTQVTPEIKIGSKIDEMINRKIEELVAKKIEEALSKL